MKVLKKFDFIIIVLLIGLSFAPHFIFAKISSKNYESTYASIKISGKFYKNIPLSSFKGKKEFIITTPYGDNTILVKDNTIQVLEADCNDELCVQQGIISNVGENLICLPHELIIEIKGDSDSSSDMILSH
jgi:hypothetical protein